MDKEKRDHDKHKTAGKQSFFQSYVGCTLEDLLCRKALLLAGLSLVIAILVSPSFVIISDSYRLGDIAGQNIKARRDLLIEDEPATQKRREEASRRSPMVYDLDGEILSQTIHRLTAAFEAMRSYREEGSLSSSERNRPEPGDINLYTGLNFFQSRLHPLEDQPMKGKKDFETLIGFAVPEDVFTNLWETGFSETSQKKIAALLKSTYAEGIVVNKASLLQAREEQVIVRNLSTRSEIVSHPPHTFPDLEEARRIIKMEALNQGQNVKEMMTMSFLASQMLHPNLSFDLEETELRRERSHAAVKPVFIQVAKNEMLVREGQRIGPEEILKLSANYEETSPGKQILAFVTMFLFSVICIWVVVNVSNRHLPSLRLDFQDLVFLGTLLVFLLLLGRLALGLAEMVGENGHLMSSRAIIYAIPLSAGAMLASVFFGVTVSLIFSLLLTLFAGMLFGKDFSLFLYFLIGSFVAAHGVSPCRTRMIPIRAGLLVGCTSMILIFLHAAVHDQFDWTKFLISSILGLSGGIFAGILTTGITPLAEMFFGYTTDIKLLELATMDQPLMQELMVQAPGTYHHSIIVGNMVEAAAKSIGANSLLAKVAAYYHDIGKIKKPLYFIENQFDVENRHEKLAPSMSSLILISHVKEGVELARYHKLGKKIIDIISQHHGKSFISFFYKKAIEAREKLQATKGQELPLIHPDDYRYPGPKPQTKEAGLVMLADVVEAACRSLTDPTSARIQGMVNRLINNIFSDGQLEECELTLKDLHQIANHFNQILATIHHKRIEYPTIAPNESRGKTDAPDSALRESKQDKDKATAAPESGKPDLKRLGIH